MFAIFAMQSLTALQPGFAAVQDPTASNSPLMAIVRVPPICPTLAADRFPFKAREIDGVPQTSTGVQYQFTFKMDN